MPRRNSPTRPVAALCLAGLALGATPLAASATCVSGWLPGTANSNMSGSIRWLSMWDPDGAGAAAPVLVAAGDFNGTNSAGFASANYVASWDGANWSALGSGLNGNAYCLTSLSSTNELFVCGVSFSMAGDNPAKRIAKWDGATWTDLATGSGNVPSLALLAMTSLNADSLAVAGAFTQVAETPASRIASWSTSGGWASVGDGLSSTTSALFRMPNGDLIAGGAALTSGDGSVTLNRIGRWDGTTWHPLGDGVSGLVRCMAVMPNGDLIVGGAFLQAGGNTVNKIARWDGTSWSGLGSGINDATSGNLDVFALAVMPNGDLIAAGDFTSAGGVPANRIARWRNGTWSALGTGVNAVVRDLEVMPNGNLAVGGDFTMAGDQAALRFAIWSEQSPVVITNEPESQVVDVDGTAVFEVDVTGTEPLTFQWQQQDLLNLPDFIDIQDGPVFDPFGNSICDATGANTGQLTLTNFSGVAQIFRCVISNACNQVASSEVTLSFNPPCLADYNQDDSLSVQDIFDFLFGYFTSDPRADVNSSGDVTVQDIFDYLAAYFSGCP